MKKKLSKKTVLIVVIAAAILIALGITLFLVLTYQADQKKAKERARLVQEYFDNKLATYAEENASSTADVVFLGDSLTDGCDLDKYYGEYSTFNRGIGGDTSSGLLNRMKVSAYDAKPKVIVLLIGGNDVLGGRSLDDLCANYEKILSGIRDNLPDTKIVWCSLTAMGGNWAKHNDTAILCNQKIKLLAEKYGCIYVDLFTPLCDFATGEIRPEYTVEGVHFTHEGYLVVSAEIKKALSLAMPDRSLDE